MSVIDKVLQGETGETVEVTLREAAVTILVSAVACDGALAPEESLRLKALLAGMRLYRETSTEHLQHLIDAAMNAVARHGAEETLPACAAVIPGELRLPLFALAVELVFADGRVAEREKRYVDALQSTFAIDEASAMKTIEVLLIKSRA